MDAEQQTQALAFVKDIELCLGVQRTSLSFREEWSKSPPEHANGLSKDEYFKNVSEGRTKLLIFQILAERNAGSW